MKKGSLPQNGDRLFDFCVRICYTIQKNKGLRGK